MDDAALKSLEPLDKLTKLDLSQTPVADAGLPALAALPKLTSLNLWLTKVSDQGVDRLQKQLPQCKINKGSQMSEVLAAWQAEKGRWMMT